METKRKNIFTILIAYFYAFIAVLLVNLVNQAVANIAVIPVRLVLYIVVWWPMLGATVFFMRRDKESLKDIGFTKEKVGYQILIGGLVAFGSLFIFIALPSFFGFQMGYVGHFDIFQLAYMLLAVALVEEVIFRGHLYKKLIDINGSKWLAIAASSVLFGLFHIFNGNLFQIVFTTLIGLYFCICRDKLKHCTLLSLIIAHSLHNTVLPVITAFFFGN